MKSRWFSGAAGMLTIDDLGRIGSDQGSSFLEVQKKPASRGGSE